ncbi:molybdopterin-dependent oxidoreductase [Petroclostridium sp. X23]|uniref:molybdopterin-dependent oxidoreductase n=1 Tax=Petroclostridium sp. X23 TaxID=3045146 RepID=UPI0024AD0A98|nr:molybdopterin-dependent oxidoreductase [Petroclostridium sp. X23]WHH57767.1 molybdopterin-dependent oxidoreductase [Petroclostridium sp. X23]
MIRDEFKVKHDKLLKKWLAALIVILMAVAAVSWCFSLDNDGLREGTVVIKAGDAVVGSFTADDLRKLPCREMRMVVITNCSGACGSSNTENSSSEHEYTGASLLDVLNSMDSGLASKYQKVITRGIDYYSQVIEMSEIMEADDVYIVFSDYGRPLKMKDGKDGSLQVVVSGDESGQRFTKWLVSLELQ